MSERIHPKIQRRIDRQKQTETIITLGHQEVPVHEIATQAKCHKSTAKKILRANDLPIIGKPLKEQVPPTPEQAKEFLLLYFGTSEKKGRSLRSAASLAGITQTAAKNFMKENNVERKDKRKKRSSAQ